MKKKEVHVELFGGETQLFEVKPKCQGQKLFQMITEFLDINEHEYFGIFILLKNHQRKWLRMDKEIKKQLKEPWIVKFGVKLYPPVVSDLIEEITRFYVYQQLREDIGKGILLSSFVTHSLLGSLAAQAELGDAPKIYGPKELNDLLALKLAPNVTTSLLERISELHMSHSGLKTSLAELKYLETASKLPLYGLHQFHVKDGEETHIILSVYSGGIMVFEKGILLNRIAWPSILELSYKRSIFYVQVRAGTVSNSISKIGFLCPTSGTAKRIWRISMEHHHFFRKEVSKPEGGSKLLLKSRTQAELISELDQNISRRLTSDSLMRARTIRSSRFDSSSRQKTISDIQLDESKSTEVIEMKRINSHKDDYDQVTSTSQSTSQASRSDSLRRNSPPPKPLRRSRVSLHHSESVRSTQSSGEAIKCSSPISSSSENEARTVIAQVHTEQNGIDQDENTVEESVDINEETPLVKSTPPISPIPKSSQIIRKPPRSPASPQLNSRPLSMGPPTTPIKENGIRGRRLGSEDLEVISSTNKFKENERMQKASSSSNILDSSNDTAPNERSLSTSNSSNSTSTLTRRLRSQDRSRSLLQIRRSFMES